jgi:hypothetical protein
MSGATVTVLGSGVAMGVYIPALLLARQLADRGVASEVAIIETLYTPAALELLSRHRKAYHDSFSLALLGHRRTRDIQPSLDPERVEGLLAAWEQEERACFAVWSGFWLPILELYRARAPRRLAVDRCRIDAEVSATFRIYEQAGFADDREIWLWNWARRQLDYELPVSELPPLPWEERDDRLVLHGGGWGIGTYREVVPELAAEGLALDLVAYDPAEVEPRAGVRHLMIAPGWTPWEGAVEGRYEFPPFGEVAAGGAATFRNRPEHHELFDFIRRSRAIVSKPGGGTLIDSLAAATPVVLLAPYGYAEERNADLWEHLGYGIRYERWEETGFDRTRLATLHQNLLRPRQTRSYPRELSERSRG